jgi:hypothetical protein
VGGCQESIARTLNLARALPTALALTTLASNAITLPIATADKITKVSQYVKKVTDLKLVATPITVQGATATSYEWIFPAGVSSDDIISSTANGVTTISSTSNIITVKFEGVDSGVLSLPISVYGVNGADKSLARTLTLSSAAPATPGAITLAIGSTPKFNPTCATSNTITIQVPSVAGCTYAWTVGGVSVDNGVSNSIVINVACLTTSTLSVSVVASNGTCPCAARTISIGKTTICGTRIAPEDAAVVAEASKVVAYPNPSHEEGFRIKSDNGKSFGVQVYDLLGRSIEQRQMLSDSKIGANYAKGVYNVIVTPDANVKTLRVIKR